MTAVGATTETTTAPAADELLERLTGSALPDAEQDLVLAATEGPSSLRACVDGEATPTPPQETSHRPVPAHPTAYLEEIACEGFRGIGPRARLQLAPGPGLTLVVGRNGSGKSSFAEALEVLLTGTTLRWEQRTKVWRDGWRNLHHDGPASIAATMRLDGVAEPLTFTRTWAPGAKLDSSLTPEVSGACDW